MPLILRCEVEYKPILTALAATCAAHLSLHATWRSFLPLSTSFIISDQSGRRRGRVLQSEINYGLVASNVGGAVLVGWLVVPLDGSHFTHFSFSRVFFCVSVSTRFSPGANGGGGGGGAFGTSDGSGGGAGTANTQREGRLGPPVSCCLVSVVCVSV